MNEIGQEIVIREIIIVGNIEAECGVCGCAREIELDGDYKIIVYDKCGNCGHQHQQAQGS